MASDEQQEYPAGIDHVVLKRAINKAYWRLLPLLFLCYVIAYIDRVNVGFAKLQMQDALKFNDQVFGFGMGIFFIGYLLLEIPGTILVEHWSARKWFSRILISWGIVAALTAWVTTPLQFYVVRFLLGVAEAGFFPGVIVFLTHWFPKRDRTKALALFFIGSPIAQIVAPRISSELMDMQGTFLGLVGWQWVYVFWGIPAVVLGFVVIGWLTDRPKNALWLSEQERETLEKTLAHQRAQVGAQSHMSMFSGLANGRVVALAFAYFFVVTANYGVELYMASIINDWYHPDLSFVAWMVMIPPVGSLVGQLLVGWSSDRTQERQLHACAPILVGALALAAVPFSNGSMFLTVSLFTVAMTGLKAYLPAFWSLPSLFLTTSAAAASIGLINSFGNLGGWLGPSVVGFVKYRVEDYTWAIWFLSVCMVISVVIISLLPVRSPPVQDTE